MKVLVAGLGNMGLCHALAHHRHRDAEIVALVNRSPITLPHELKKYPFYSDFETALEETSPELAVIATYSDSHADYAIRAMQAGAHVFVEKPLAMSVEAAREVVAVAQSTGRKLVVGYILRHHPAWQRFIAEARAFGGPFVMRLNLNQQSVGPTWKTHKALMQSTSPIVDCGVHYVDVMCQVTGARALRVSAIGLRLSDDIPEDNYNYGQLQVTFEDGSVGWYEVGWGPMMSEEAAFVKDIISPCGAVSIISQDGVASDDLEGQSRVASIKVHRIGEEDRLIDIGGAPGHQVLCDTEQDFILDAIARDLDLTRHMADAVQSLAICLAADQSVRTGRTIELEEPDDRASA